MITPIPILAPNVFNKNTLILEIGNEDSKKQILMIYQAIRLNDDPGLYQELLNLSSLVFKRCIIPMV